MFYRKYDSMYTKMDVSKMQHNDVKLDSYQFLSTLYQLYTRVRLKYPSELTTLESRLMAKVVLKRLRCLYIRLKSTLTVENINKNPIRACRILVRAHDRFRDLQHHVSLISSPTVGEMSRSLNAYVRPISGVYQDTCFAASFTGLVQSIYVALSQRHSAVTIYVSKHVSEPTKQFYLSVAHDIRWFNDKDTRHLKRIWKTSGPVAVVVDSIGEGIHAGSFPMTSFFSIYRRCRRTAPFYFILDTTTVGPTAQPSHYLSRRKFHPWFHWLMIRDLNGVDQSGMNLAPMASSTYLGKHKRQFLPLLDTMKVVGQLLPENQLGLISVVGQKNVVQRLSRHHRNGVVLYNRLQKFMNRCLTVFDTVVMGGYSEGRQLSTGDVYIQLRSNGKMSRDETIDQVMTRWCHQMGRDGGHIECGSGRGLYVTRVCCHSVSRGVSYIHISPGYENISIFDGYINGLFSILKLVYTNSDVTT